MNARCIAPTAILSATLGALSASCAGDGDVMHPNENGGLKAPDHFATIGGDFTLTDQDGEPFQLSKHHGKVALLFFGYTFCPDVCPLTLSRLALALDLLSESERSEVLVLFVSVDPQRDTAERLTEYLGFFAMPVIGLTGTLEEIDQVTSRYGAFSELSPTTTNAGYLVDHTSYIFLMDRQGRIRGLSRQSDAPQRIAELTRLMLD